MSETKFSGGELFLPSEGRQRYINLNPGRLFVQQPTKNGKGSKASLKLLR